MNSITRLSKNIMEPMLKFGCSITSNVTLPIQTIMGTKPRLKSWTSSSFTAIKVQR